MVYKNSTEILNKLKTRILFMKHYAPNRCEPSIEFQRGGGGGGGDQGRCERRSEFFVKIKKKKIFGGRGGRVGGGGGGGVMVDVNREVKFL